MHRRLRDEARGSSGRLESRFRMGSRIRDLLEKGGERGARWWRGGTPQPSENRNLSGQHGILDSDLSQAVAPLSVTGGPPGPTTLLTPRAASRGKGRPNNSQGNNAFPYSTSRGQQFAARAGPRPSRASADGTTTADYRPITDPAVKPRTAFLFGLLRSCDADPEKVCHPAKPEWEPLFAC